MNTAISWIFDLLDEIDKRGDPRVREWFLMQSPCKAILIVIIYLYFVLKLGPKIMENRRPFNVEKMLMLYNGMQVVISTYVFEEAFRLIWLRNDYHILCMNINYSDSIGTELARTVWFYYMAKGLDLLDTVFFVLRKKQSHVTFLHVYHHTMVFALGWVVTKYYPGGQVVVFGTVNAFVHMIMYSYYFITSTHLIDGKNLWWKKYITQLQLIQFVIVGIHAIISLLIGKCDFPKFIVILGITQDLLMIYLFLKFYKKAYPVTKNKTSH